MGNFLIADSRLFQLTPVEFGFQEKIEIYHSFKVKHRNHEESPIKLMEGEMSQRGFIRVRFRKKKKNEEETVQLLVIDNFILFLFLFGIAPLSYSFQELTFFSTQQKLEYETVKQNLPGKKGLVCEQTCLLLDILKMLKDEM